MPLLPAPMAPGMTLPFKSWLRMAWEIAISLFILNLILDLLESFFNLGQVRSIIFAPLSFLKGLKGD